MIPLTFRRLEVFIAVVDEGSFVAAADKLAISHPSVSNHIRALEDMMDCELFQRRRGTVSSLTEQGRRLYEHGQDLLAHAALIQKDIMQQRPRRKREVLQISSQRSVAKSWLCRPMAIFARERPDVEFLVEVGGFDQTIADVLEQRVDIGFLMSYDKIIDIASEKIGRATFSFYCAQNHPLGSKSEVSIQELKTYPLISTKRDTRFGQMEVHMMADAGVSDFKVLHQIQEGTIVQELVKLGLGMFCGLDAIAASQVHSGSLVRIPVAIPEMAMDVYYVLAPRKRQSKLALSFLDFLKAYQRRGEGRASKPLMTAEP